jgi:phosphatidate phosphatase PAH1
MFDTNKYNFISVGNGVKLTGKHSLKNTNVIEVYYPDVPIKDIKKLIPGVWEIIYTVLGDESITNALVWQENNEWVIFDVDEDPTITTWKKLENAVGKKL